MQKYRNRISEPLRDRVDLIVEVPAVPVSALGAGPTGDSSAEIRRRVIAARTRQAERFAGTAVRANSALQYRMVE